MTLSFHPLWLTELCYEEKREVVKSSHGVSLAKHYW